MNKYMSIPYDNKVSLQFSGAFYYRIQSLIIEYCKDKSNEEIIAALNQINDGTIENDNWLLGFETLMILVKDLEEKFIDEKKVNFSENPPQEVSDYLDSIQDLNKEKE